jgi:hypothetical protein
MMAAVPAGRPTDKDLAGLTNEFVSRSTPTDYAGDVAQARVCEEATDEAGVFL